MLDMYEICQRLARHEGIRLSPYRCSKGKLTIGIGRNLEANPLSKEELKIVGDWRHGITKQAAFYLLRNDICHTEKELRRRIAFWEQLDDERQYALLDMAFNLGAEGLCKFKKMLGFLWMGDYKQAAAECLNSQYAKDTGRRSRCIAATIRTGKYSPQI